jgi:hypothetical protein
LPRIESSAAAGVTASSLEQPNINKATKMKIDFIK